MGKKPILSICFPVYNRIEPLEITLSAVLEQIDKIKNHGIEVVVSVNPSEDGDKSVINFVNGLQDKYEFKLNINSINIGPVNNMKIAIEMAKGKYIWMIGDDDLIIEGGVNKIYSILCDYPDVSWVFMNSARLNGRLQDRTSKISGMSINKGETGYFKNGKKKIIDMHKKIDGSILFSTANIYLRDAAIKMIPYAAKDNMCNCMSYTFYSASMGAAYIITEPLIIAGLELTWNNRKRDVIHKYYNDAILAINGFGYTRKEAVSLYGYRMRHMALYTWFDLFRLILKRDESAKIVYKKHLNTIPFTTIIATIFAPIIAPYLLIRHRVRNCYKKKAVNNMSLSDPIYKENVQRITKLS